MARTGRPSSGQKTVGFLIKLTESDNDLLKELASKTSVSKSSVLRTALHEYAEKINKN